MKKTYAFIPEGGWPATTFRKLEDLSDDIFSLARKHPTGYLGRTENADNIGVIFKGVTIRLLKSAGLGARGYEIRVEILEDVKQIKQGFIDLWMYLSDNGYVIGEPSERVEVEKIDDILDTEIIDSLHRSHRDEFTLLLAAAKIKADPMSSVYFCDLKLKTVAKNYLNESQYRSAIYCFTEEIKFRFPKKDPEEEIEIMRVKELGVNPRNLSNWAKVLKNQENKK